MPIEHNLYTLGTAPSLVVPNDNMPQEVHLHNMTKSSNEYIYIGGANVGTGNSLHLDPGESITMTLRPGDQLYALSDPSGLELGVLAIKKSD
jgi:hypothetical protein